MHSRPKHNSLFWAAGALRTVLRAQYKRALHAATEAGGSGAGVYTHAATEALN